MAGKAEDGDGMKQHVQEEESVLTTAIGQQLKELYEGVAQEPIPDRFVNLLKELEKSSATDGSDDDIA